MTVPEIHNPAGWSYNNLNPYQNDAEPWLFNYKCQLENVSEKR